MSYVLENGETHYNSIIATCRIVHNKHDVYEHDFFIEHLVVDKGGDLFDEVYDVLGGNGYIGYSSFKVLNARSIST